jgi:carboxyl-terminal processing protease
MPARNVLVLVVVTAACLAAWAVRGRDPATRRLAEVLAVAERVSLEPVDRRGLIDAAVAAVVARLGDDAALFDAAVFDAASFDAGNGPAAAAGDPFGGVGLELAIDESSREPVVIAPRAGAAAWVAGVRGGDRIVAIDGVATRGLTLSEVVQRLRGPPGEAVTLRVCSASSIVAPDGPSLLPAGEEVARCAVPREVTLVREIVLPETVVGDRRRPDGSWTWDLEDAPGIAILRITAFGERTAAEFDAAFATIAGGAAGGCAGLVLDLRGNEGGSPAAAVAVCDRFLQDGVIVATRRRRGVGTTVDIARATRETSIDVPVAVLVDRRTAGVAEVVAACLQDHGRAAIVGSRTAGRGVVQSLVTLGDGSQVRLTTAEYLRPAGIGDPAGHLLSKGRGRLHRPEGAGDAARWGVEPDPGLSIEPTGAALARLAVWRWHRDTPPGGSPVIRVVALEPSAAESFDPLPPLPRDVDAVLATAVEWLQTQVATALTGPSEAAADLGSEEETAGDADQAMQPGE